MSAEYAVHAADDAVAFSLLSILQNANSVVQAVVILLLLLSVYSWAVIISSFAEIKSQKKKVGFFGSLLKSGSVTIEDLYNRIDLLKQADKNSCVATSMISAAVDLLRGGKKDQMFIENGMRMEVERIMFAQERSLAGLANISSIAPFIGLFGTIIGIMHSFNSIFAVQSVSLRIIAPSISEALFATAMGIFVAVPAGMFYNKLVYEARCLKNEAEVLIYSFAKNL